jgi:hypothetical protein
MRHARPFQCLFGVAVGTLLALSAQSDPIVNTTDLNENVVVETDTFETADGSVLFTTNGVGYSSWLTPNIAADLAADTTLPLQIQSTAFLIPQVSELEFLTNPITGNAYLVIDGAGPAIENQTGTEYLQLDSELETAGGPGYSMIGSPITTSVGVWSYSTSATEPNGSTLDGTVNFQVSDINIVEQPIGAATPEPSMAILLGAALCSLVLYRSVFPHRKRRRLSTEGTK